LPGRGMSKEEQTEVIQQFVDKVIEVAKQFIYPVLYKTVVYFYSKAIELKLLEQIKEPLIIEITQLIISGPLSHKLQQLGRFTTFNEELMLAKNYLLNCNKSLDDFGVEKKF